MTNSNVEKIKDDFKEACKGLDVQKVIRCFYTYEEALFKYADAEAACSLSMEVIEYFFIHDMLEKAIYYSVRFLKIYDMSRVNKPTLFHAIYATLEYMQENFSEALIHMEAELDVHKAESNKRAEVICLSNVGALQIIDCKYLPALNTLLDAKLLLLELGMENTEFDMKVRLNLARVYAEIKEYEVAKKYLDEVMQWQYIDGIPVLKIEMYTNFGRLSIDLGEYDNAFMYMEVAIELCEEENMDFELKNLYKLISETYIELGSYTESVNYLQKYSALAWEMSRKTQKAIRQLAEAEISLKMRENVVKGQRKKYLQIVREDEYDLLTNTFSKSYLKKYVENLISNRDKHNTFSIMFMSIENLSDIQKNLCFRGKEYIMVEVASMVVNLPYSEKPYPANFST